MLVCVFGFSSFFCCGKNLGGKLKLANDDAKWKVGL